MPAIEGLGRKEKYEQEYYCNSNGDIDIEYPVPGKAIGNIPSQRWADYGRQAPSPADESLVFASLGWGEEVSNNRKGVGHHNTRAETLESAEDYQLGHGLAQSG